MDFVDYIDNMQLELDVLKDVLSSGNCTIDTATLMGVRSVYVVSLINACVSMNL